MKGLNMTAMKIRPILLSICALWLSLGAYAHAQSLSITLRNDFIRKYKDSVLMQHAPFIIDKAHKSPNAPSSDGDLHIAGRSQAIGLPIVAEIMNAKAEKQARKAVAGATGTGEPVSLSGVWRIWCEHAGGEPQVQGDLLEPFTTTNPDHVFEFHPVTSIEGINLLPTLKFIKGYKPKQAEQAFLKYEGLDARIRLNSDSTTTFFTEGAGYNYVLFKARFEEFKGADAQPKQVPGGEFVYASIHTLDGDLLVRKMRLVFVEGSQPHKKYKAVKTDDELTLLGIPRMSLKELDRRIGRISSDPAIANRNFPYEIIVVGAR